MHRAATRALRTTYRCTARTLTRSSRRGLLLPQQPSAAVAYGARQYHRNPARSPQHAGHAIEPLQSSMYIRRFSAAFVSGLVGYGAWYTYNGNGTATDSHDAVARSFATTTATTTSDAAAPTRTVLVIGADELHTGTYVGEGPISKTTGNDGKRVVEMITPDQATEKLRKTEQSYFVNRGQGVLRYDLVQLPSNDPIEDDHAEKIVEVPGRNGASDVPNSDWMFWGVFDGHSGWTTSAKLRQTLINTVANELNDTYKAAPGHSPAAEAVEAAIKAGFTKLDDEIVHQSVEKVLNSGSKTMAAELLQPALSGSCALLSFYDSRSKLLRVACTGDSRAVLGRRSDSGKWTATALSVDQTGSNPDEAARMRKLHPGEDRVTPPYVTAEPVVTTTKVNPENGDFLVLATDGLWEMLTNEEVVGLVGKWIETQASGSSSNSQFDSTWARIFGSGNKPQLPVEHAKGQDVGGQKTPIRLQQWGISPDAPERFVVKDKNVATHLVRNALGGKNEEQVTALLTLPAPFSRRYRDDLTVQVIFFGNGSKTGEVVVNLEATAPEEPVKAKL
ncbi:hypothetical protein HYQ45_017198 [Verticillium longisporum]|uniref:PPM-type phosphatase domain-containing protein n=1 Tax=Verticillium longisporum TaxID=100787 RepID=A0A8I2Z2X7_VERLO|nr:hypothetical protein HYQ45_017198 [Verticillium longisporum]